jgi:GH15 family glucan-1,4-alpha-glucosidase
LLIEDYAMIGDLHTAALVGRNGSIDWLCWPDFGSAACFASLLGTADNGFWQLAPADQDHQIERRYLPHTLILETTHRLKDGGSVQVVDFMPVGASHSHVIRIVRGLKGMVGMRGALALRFDYGQTVPWVMRTERGIRAEAGPDAVELQTEAPLCGEDFTTVSEFTVSEGETISFVLTHGSYGDYREHSVGDPLDAISAYDQTAAFWKEWSAKGKYKGPYAEIVERSLITLKALTFEPTGGIVASPTTSLPEDLGGIRNWDYRYCWLRDTTFTLLAFMNSGYYDEARDWMRWLRRTVAGSPEQIQIMYGISGERRLAEWEIEALPGYENSRPVRIGNAAAEQLQLDTYGEVLDAFFWASSKLEKNNLADDFAVLRKLVEHLEKIWDQPDRGIWEVRGEPKHFTNSKVMAWVAFDRALKIAKKNNFEAPLARWKTTRDTIHKQVCEKAFNQQLNSFVQHYDGDQLDASLLLMPMVGFLPSEDGLVMRYDHSKSEDGLAGSEGKFLACSFWMVSNLKMIGRDEDARRLFENLLSLCNDTGLLSEEYDSRKNRMAGNFPQAFSHIALLSAASQLAEKGEQRHSANSATEQPRE